MHIESRKTNQNEQEPVVRIEHSRVQVEIEIDRHVKIIRSLIQKLHPAERQQYFAGLLSHLLTQSPEYPFPKYQKKEEEIDFSALSANDLELIKELSQKLEELHRLDRTN